jgi:glutathione S-transferase
MESGEIASWPEDGEVEVPRITLFIQPGFQVPGRPRCFSGTPFAVKVQRILQYKGIPFEVREVGWLERAELLPKISRSKKLPVLEYEGERVEDSSAIAYYLEDLHPEPALIPRDPLVHARSHFIEEWADEVLYWYNRYEIARFGNSEIQIDAYFRELPEAARRIAAERSHEAAEESLERHGIGRYPKEKVMADVRQGLDGLTVLFEAQGFAAGPELSLADLALFGQIHRRLAGTNPWFEGEIAARPTIRDWLRRVDERTAPEQP